MPHFQIHNIFSCPNDPFFCSKAKMHSLKTTQVFLLKHFFITWWIPLLRKFHHLDGTDIIVLRCMFTIPFSVTIMVKITEINYCNFN